jgi:hypothetical protein
MLNSTIGGCSGQVSQKFYCFIGIAIFFST